MPNFIYKYFYEKVFKIKFIRKEMEYKEYRWEARYLRGRVVAPYIISFCYGGEHNTEDDTDFAEVVFNPNEIRINGKEYAQIKKILRKNGETKFILSPLKGNNRKQKRALARLAVRDKIREAIKNLGIESRLQ